MQVELWIKYFFVVVDNSGPLAMHGNKASQNLYVNT